MLLPLQSTIGTVVIVIPLVLLILMWFYMYSNLESGTLQGQ